MRIQAELEKGRRKKGTQAEGEKGTQTEREKITQAERVKGRREHGLMKG